MKAKSMTAVGVAVIALSTHGAFAAGAVADGQITFTGEVTAQTCTINGNGTGSANFTVALPTVSATTLASAGATAGRTPFNIALTGCTPDSGSVHTFFEAGPTIDAATGHLVLDAGGATNVEIGLQNADFSDIALGQADGSQNSRSASINAGSATLNYYAQYVSLGGAKPGAANSSVMYTMSYE